MEQYFADDEDFFIDIPSKQAPNVPAEDVFIPGDDTFGSDDPKTLAHFSIGLSYLKTLCFFF